MSIIQFPGTTQQPKATRPTACVIDLPVTSRLVLTSPDYEGVMTSELGIAQDHIDTCVEVLHALLGFDDHTPQAVLDAARRDMEDEGRLCVALIELRSGGADGFEDWAESESFGHYCLSDALGGEDWVSEMRKAADVFWLLEKSRTQG
jgi:hypothetical protein